MKTVSIVIAALLVLACAFPASAQESVLPAKADRAAIEKNLVIGLRSDNVGLQRSAALMLGKIRAENALIPLLDALHNNKDEGVRTAAAYALCKIGNPIGTYAVKMAVRFDNCCKVQLASAWYYENYVKPGTFAFRQVESQLLAAMLDY